MDIQRSYEDYTRVEKALKYLSENYRERPSLKQIASASGLSEYHFQRIFTSWAGISPARFIKYLSKENIKAVLLESENMLEASVRSGLTSTSRLHELMVTTEAVSPGDIKRKGKGLDIRYGIHPSPFGSCLVALTEKGICHLGFINDEDRDIALEDLYENWRNANFIEDERNTGSIVKNIFDVQFPERPPRLNLYIKGTNFQIKVWEALIRIPPGYMLSYEDVAGMSGRPDAVRAVASAVAKNPVSFLIPCHRVIRKMGVVNNYRWGAEKKFAILGWEYFKTGESGE